MSLLKNYCVYLFFVIDDNMILKKDIEYANDEKIVTFDTVHGYPYSDESDIDALIRLTKEILGFNINRRDINHIYTDKDVRNNQFYICGNHDIMIDDVKYFGFRESAYIDQE